MDYYGFTMDLVIKHCWKIPHLFSYHISLNFNLPNQKNRDFFLVFPISHGLNLVFWWFSGGFLVDVPL